MYNMKQIKVMSMLACAAMLFSSCGGSKGKKQSETSQQNEAEQAEAQQKIADRIAALPEEPEFDIITTLGTIRVKLYAKTPKHKANFAKLAFEGFYDGILFHRVIDGFMIQTGDPLTKDPDRKSSYGTGGPGYTVPAEIVPEYRHLKGALAAARRGDAANPLRESSGSQFYIVQDADVCAQLDGQYTVFGQTVDGFDVIDKIAQVQTDARDCPLSPVKIVTIKLAE